VTVSAHAVQAGPEGNIRAWDVNGACCRANVFARNTGSFTGGQDERSFPTVNHADIDRVAASLKQSLQQSVQAAYQPQVKPQEALVTPACQFSTTQDHAVNSEAATVTVTVSEACSGMAYDSQSMQQRIIQAQTQAANQQLGAGYQLNGTVQYSITKTEQQKGELRLTAEGKGIWAYQFTQQERLVGKDVDHLPR
jgi:hypothetical protein